MTALDAQLRALRGEVEALFGRSLLRLQRLELVMKALVAQHHVRAVAADGGSLDVQPVTEAGKMMLGQVVGEMLGSFVRGDGQGLAEASEETAPFSIGFSVTLPAETYTRIETELRELVGLRNGLVHHFLTEHDLDSLEGCGRAVEALTDVLARVGRFFDELRPWVEDIERLRIALSSISPEVLDAMVVRERVVWRHALIAQALEEAAAELASGEWVPLSDAVHWINRRYPEETPEGYGCASWPQVVHESRLFDLERRMVNGQRMHWYRLRQRGSEVTER